MTERVTTSYTFKDLKQADDDSKSFEAVITNNSLDMDTAPLKW